MVSFKKSVTWRWNDTKKSKVNYKTLDLSDCKNSEHNVYQWKPQNGAHSSLFKSSTEDQEKDMAVLRWVSRSTIASFFKHNYSKAQSIMKHFQFPWYHLSILFHFLLQWDNPRILSRWIQSQWVLESLGRFQLAGFSKS